MNSSVRIDDKYRLSAGRAYMTGIQALVRLPMMQRRRDLAAGLNTAGYISGYRGSPLGGLDQQLVAAAEPLSAHHVVFQPGVNEDLAATAVWGTQQAELDGQGRYDGVFAMWYGKGPGVDRSGDALRHGNLAGSSRHGGVLVLLGDDHTCESSTTAHQSEYAMQDAMIPVLNPAGVQEFLDYGIYGWALSRYSGCWAALKCIHDTVESAASVEVDDDRIDLRLPDADEYLLPPQGLNIRWPDTPQQQEQRLHRHKLEAAQAFCRVNRLDRTLFDGGERPSLGIVTTGKSYLDVLQALDELDIDADAASRLGLKLYKVAMPFPLEPDGALEFCRGLRQVIVVEEKRGLIESQLKNLLYGQPDAPRSVIGKRDEQRRPLFDSAGRLDSNEIALAIGGRLLDGRRDGEPALALRLDQLRGLNRGELLPAAMTRTPYFCPGCPHNTSTRVPDGSQALAGIGCHYMAQWMDRSTARFTQMGAEGASWIGEAPFSKRQHVFQNIGDGTYFHSGLLALRAAKASGVRMTYKILYNDAVAMTGGQSVDGSLDAARITRQVRAEGVERIAVVTDEPEKYPADAGFADGVTVHHRDRLDAVQRELRELPGLSAIVYDQTCAAEKRRRRKRGRFPDPAVRAFINEAVCEGCGDCGEKSNCVAIVPVDTDFGRKRAVDQSACNKDYSCVKGFCPSFVTVHGGELKKPAVISDGDGDGDDDGNGNNGFAALPAPTLPDLSRPYHIVIVGVGGTGIVTVGALLGMAAHIDGKGCTVLDMMGLAQKGGAVTSHLRIGATPDALSTTRIAAGGADLVLGCDLVVAAGADARRTMRAGRTRVVVNGQPVMTGDFTRNADAAFPKTELLKVLDDAVGADAVALVEATRLATALLGDSIAANLFLLGYAYQLGLLPVTLDALDKAVELNGVAVAANRSALRWGRRAAVDSDRVGRIAEPTPPLTLRPQTLDQLIEQRERRLTAYQNTRYARRYRALVERVRKAEQTLGDAADEPLAGAVARYYDKLLAYKDEYEVARLYSDGAFAERLSAVFDGDYRLRFHLAPPLLAKRGADGEPQKRAYGPWIRYAFATLARLRGLRGTPFDPFGYSAERRQERALITEYESTIDTLLDGLSAATHRRAVDIASLPEQVRGFGPVKQRHIDAYRRRRAQLLADYDRPAEPPNSAAA